MNSAPRRHPSRQQVFGELVGNLHRFCPADTVEQFDQYHTATENSGSQNEESHQGLHLLALLDGNRIKRVEKSRKDSVDTGAVIDLHFAGAHQADYGEGLGDGRSPEGSDRRRLQWTGAVDDEAFLILADLDERVGELDRAIRKARLSQLATFALERAPSQHTIAEEIDGLRCE